MPRLAFRPASRRSFGSFTTALAVLVILASSPDASAARRKVLGETFTATWCPPCLQVDQATSMLIDQFGDDVVMFMAHVRDAYEIPWCYNRIVYHYGQNSIPDVWIDGLWEHHGNAGTPQQNYDIMVELIEDRLREPTDVVLNIYAELIEGRRYLISVPVLLEPEGQARTVALLTFQTLDHYPAFDPVYRNCIKLDLPRMHIDLRPGEITLFEYEITFDQQSWNQQEDIRMIAWTQPPVYVGPAEVDQAEEVFWPLPKPPDCNGNGEPDYHDIINGISPDENGNGIPDECECRADINRDGTVDVGDLLLLLAAWGNTSGPEDINNDGIVDVGDLLLLLASWGPCP